MDWVKEKRRCLARDRKRNVSLKTLLQVLLTKAKKRRLTDDCVKSNRSQDLKGVVDKVTPVVTGVTCEMLRVKIGEWS